MIGRRSLRISVRDEVSGFCPCCPTPDIELAYETGGGMCGALDYQEYVLRCRHQKVCRLRERFMEDVISNGID